MPEYRIRLAEEFSEGLALIWSERVLDHIRVLLHTIAKNPEIGSSDVRKSLVRRYGPNLRKLAVSKFLIIYRFDGETIDVLALVYGPQVT